MLCRNRATSRCAIIQSQGKCRIYRLGCRRWQQSRNPTFCLIRAGYAYLVPNHREIGRSTRLTCQWAHAASTHTSDPSMLGGSPPESEAAPSCALRLQRAGVTRASSGQTLLHLEKGIMQPDDTLAANSPIWKMRWPRLAPWKAICPANTSNMMMPKLYTSAAGDRPA
jgi:hypothetical protein